MVGVYGVQVCLDFRGGERLNGVDRVMPVGGESPDPVV